MTSTATARGKARKSEVTPYQMYIDGKFVDAKSGKTFDVYAPSTEGVIATVPAGGHDPSGNRPSLTFVRHENEYKLSAIWESANDGLDVMD